MLRQFAATSLQAALLWFPSRDYRVIVAFSWIARASPWALPRLQIRWWLLYSFPD
jgi:hypothetical protein